jgi:sarcosine oxidase
MLIEIPERDERLQRFLTNSAITDVVVVGSGVFGSWIALTLRRTGRSVALIERFSPAHPQSSSGGESRIIRMAYGGDALYTRMAAESLAVWRALFRAENANDIFRQTGVLWLANRTNQSLRATESTLKNAAVRFAILPPEELQARYPQARFEPDTVAIFEPDSGALLAEKAVHAVHSVAIREGVVYRQGMVQPPVRAGHHLEAVTTDKGERITGGTFVFACGAWLPKLFPALLDGIIQPTRQELFFFQPPFGDLSFSPERLPIWIDETESRLAYGFPELDGAEVKTAFHRLGKPFDPDQGERQITPAEIEEAHDYLTRRFPAMATAQLKSSRVCQYENTSSGDFLIDRHPHLENVWIVGGGSGHGFKHGPAIAEYVARIAFEDTKPEPRFLLQLKTKELDRKVI